MGRVAISSGQCRLDVPGHDTVARVVVLKI